MYRKETRVSDMAIHLAVYHHNLYTFSNQSLFPPPPPGQAIICQIVLFGDLR